MASYRPDKMASLVREIASEVIANHLQDPRISRFASITRVEVSGDLRLAKVFVSIMGSETERRNTMRGLENARGRVQRAVARGVKARVCPELSFYEDDSIKRSAEMLQLIRENVPPEDESLADEDAVISPDDESLEADDAAEQHRLGAGDEEVGS